MFTKEGRKAIRYSISFKQMVVREIEEGNSYKFVGKKYDIGGHETISKWVIKFGKHHLLNKIVRIETMNEKDRLKQLEKENIDLKVALAGAYMAKDCLEGVIRLANEEYKTDLKKNFGTGSANKIKSSTKLKTCATTGE